MTVMYILLILFMYHLPKSCILNSKRYKQYPDIAKNITQLRCLQLTKYNYRWFKFPIDIGLGTSILYLYNNYLREEAEKRK